MFVACDPVRQVAQKLQWSCGFTGLFVQPLKWGRFEHRLERRQRLLKNKKSWPQQLESLQAEGTCPDISSASSKQSDEMWWNSSNCLTQRKKNISLITPHLDIEHQHEQIHQSNSCLSSSLLVLPQFCICLSSSKIEISNVLKVPCSTSTSLRILRLRGIEVEHLDFYPVFQDKKNNKCETPGAAEPATNSPSWRPPSRTPSSPPWASR